MSGNEYYPTRPKAPQDATKVAAGSPLAVLGIFLETLRERFRDDANVGFVWRPDPSTTDLLIEAGYTVTHEAGTYGRGLFVNRLQTVPQEIALGNLAGVHLPSHKEGFIAVMESLITVDCVSAKAGESMLLGDIVQHFFMASGNIFEAMYGFHDLSLPELGQTVPYTHDQDKFSTTVTFKVQYFSRWATVKIRPLLAEVALRAPTGSAHFEEVATTSLRKFPYPQAAAAAAARAAADEEC